MKRGKTNCCCCFSYEEKKKQEAILLNCICLKHKTETVQQETENRQIERKNLKYDESFVLNFLMFFFSFSFYWLIPLDLVFFSRCCCVVKFTSIFKRSFEFSILTFFLSLFKNLFNFTIVENEFYIRKAKLMHIKWSSSWWIETVAWRNHFSNKMKKKVIKEKPFHFLCILNTTMDLLFWIFLRFMQLNFYLIYLHSSYFQTLFSLQQNQMLNKKMGFFISKNIIN